MGKEFHEVPDFSNNFSGMRVDALALKRVWGCFNVFSIGCGHDVEKFNGLKVCFICSSALLKTFMIAMF